MSLLAGQSALGPTGVSLMNYLGEAGSLRLKPSLRASLFFWRFSGDLKSWYLSNCSGDHRLDFLGLLSKIRLEQAHGSTIRFFVLARPKMIRCRGSSLVTAPPVFASRKCSMCSSTWCGT